MTGHERTTPAPRSGSPDVMRFGDFCLHLSDARLDGPHGPVSLRRKATELLAHLLLARGRLVSKDELVATVWRKRAISDSALTSTLKDVRRALDDCAREPVYIQSVYGQGYRMLVDVSDEQAARTDPWCGGAPARSSGLLGREADIERTMRQLSATDTIVTMIGAPGCGTSRVAIEAAERWHHDTDRPIHYLDLRPLDDDAASTRLEAARALTGLLLVDHVGCDQPRARAALAELARDRGASMILATSCAPLDLPAERLVRVAPLSSNDAVALAVAQAEALGRPLESGELGSLSALVATLGCLPGAIERVASLLASLGPSALLDMADDALFDAPRAGVGHAAGLPDNFDRRIAALPERDRQALARLTVFAGPFSAEAAQSVLSDLGLADPQAATLKTLIERGLVEPRDDRLALLHPVRLAARRSFDATDEHQARAAHARYYAERFRSCWDDFCGAPISDAALDARYAVDLGEVEAALATATVNPALTPLACDLVFRSVHLWAVDAPVLPNAIEVLASSPLTTDQRARLEVARAVIDMRRAAASPAGGSCAPRPAPSDAIIDEGAWPIVYAHCANAVLAFTAQDYGAARRHLDRALALPLGEGPCRGAALVRSIEAAVMATEGARDEARQIGQMAAMSLLAIGANASVRFWQSALVRHSDSNDLGLRIDHARRLIADIGGTPAPQDAIVLRMTLGPLIGLLVARGSDDDIDEGVALATRFPTALLDIGELAAMDLVAHLAHGAGRLDLAAKALGRREACHQHEPAGGSPARAHPLQDRLERELGYLRLLRGLEHGAQASANDILCELAQPANLRVAPAA